MPNALVSKKKISLKEFAPNLATASTSTLLFAAKPDKLIETSALLNALVPRLFKSLHADVIAKTISNQFVEMTRLLI